MTDTERAIAYFEAAMKFWKGKKGLSQDGLRVMKAQYAALTALREKAEREQGNGLDKRWVRTEDRLPDINGDEVEIVLCAWIAPSFKGNPQFYVYDLKTNHYVHHHKHSTPLWMPLPEVPDLASTNELVSNSYKLETMETQNEQG